MKPALRSLFAVVAAAALLRAFAMTWLHPLNWDEVEYFRTTSWVWQGLVPYRDFWEHHTPLQWFVFAPFTALTNSPGAGAVLFMRWMQVPLWIAAFWLVNRLMQRAGLDTIPRWTAIALAVTSSLLMTSAIEYRVDALANVLYLGGLVAVMSRGPLIRPSATFSPAHAGEKAWECVAGVLLTLTVLANLRLAPLVLVTVLLTLSWRVAAGAAATGLASLLYFAVTDSLQPLYQHVWLDNYVGEQLAERVPWAFAHRILVTFGLAIYGGRSLPDIAGAAIIIAGVAGMALVLYRWRERGPLFLIAILQVVNILFLMRMKFVYHYHLQIAVLLMLPFVAFLIERIRWTRAAVAFAVFALAVNVPLVALRGKELDLQYQDRIMREVHARTAPDAKVFDGVGWAIRREPAYRFWFLPVLARQLVAAGHAEPYTAWRHDPPAAIITDRNAKVWLSMNPDLAMFVRRHYLPLWRDLWLPALSASLAGGETAEWLAPVSGRYRVTAPGPVQWTIDGVAVEHAPAFDLARGQRVAATAAAPMRVLLIPGKETEWFRQPPQGATIDGELPRVWHIPFSEPTPTSSARP